MVRPFSPTTILVHEAILTQLSEPPNWFAVRDIVDELGVGRQLVSNIASRMVSLGLLERDRGRYVATDGNLKAVVTYVLQSKDVSEEATQSRRLIAVDGVFTQDDTAAIKTITDKILYAQQHKYEGYVQVKQEWLNSLEEAQAAIRREIKYARTHSKTKRTFEEEDITAFIERAVE